MANLNDICKEITENVEHALAAAVVDIDSGLLLGVSHNTNYFDQSILDTVAAASVEMFRGRSTQAVEGMLAELRGQPAGHSIQELLFSTEHTHHFMAIVPGKPDSLAILVTRNNVRLGLGWTSLQGRLKEIAKACP